MSLVTRVETPSLVVKQLRHALSQETKAGHYVSSHESRSFAQETLIYVGPDSIVQRSFWDSKVTPVVLRHYL